MSNSLACLGIADEPEGDCGTTAPYPVSNLVGWKQGPLKPTPNDTSSFVGVCTDLSRKLMESGSHQYKPRALGDQGTTGCEESQQLTERGNKNGEQVYLTAVGLMQGTEEDN